mgnify:CR=1 FL=1
MSSNQEREFYLNWLALNLKKLENIKKELIDLQIRLELSVANIETILNALSFIEKEEKNNEEDSFNNL